ncbi:phosphoheptose isomerase [Candidatus Beckwithbacteria bacterium CG10_big_fil_rev_8_21_14_0_10_34_10]|uniref:Phosphoheptose isomerase n=1 Tax=Candidatus Beckwithbacteria bacterium CG10_big_fil_rev_8_21_14_0_10_34_10 TaxID=1974495 RepID=A0A2H0W9R6_9BACT|nr:MAG: phosphoheptose isomerase [Candidatus Beckwithbacteria bacterium CG10_big_fil_rev_8_21_14_0_10_34_10]
MNINDRIKNHLRMSIKTKEEMVKKNVEVIKQAALAIVETYYKKGGVVYTFGNGGSAADAQHIAGELLCMLRTNHRFEYRFPLPAHALTTDSSVLTAVSNDLGFEHIFSRQLEALAKPEDLVIGITTSGNSPDIVNGFKLAKKRGVKSIAFLGGSGGVIIKQKLADIIVNIPAQDVTHIQEGHVAAFHAICDVMEQLLFSDKGLEIK